MEDTADHPHAGNADDAVKEADDLEHSPDVELRQ